MPAGSSTCDASVVWRELPMTNAIKQFFVLAAVIAISMVFVIQFRPGTNVDVSGGPGCAIEISGECVPDGDFKTAFRLAAPALEAEQLDRMRFRHRVVDGLVERWILLKEAKRLQISVSDDAVTKQIGKGIARFSLPVADEQTMLPMLAQYLRGQLVIGPDGPGRRMQVTNAKSGKFDYERYKRWIARMTTKTLKDFREFQTAEATAARVRSIVRSRVRVSDVEARSQFERINEKVVADHLKLERSYYRDYVIDQGGKAVANWAKDNKEQADEAWAGKKDNFLPECRQARHILVRIDDTNPDKDAATKEARAKIDDARKELADGKAFAKVARKVSDDPRTADDGGRLGCFAAGKLTQANTGKAIDDAVFALAAGKLSAVIETPNGFHVVKLDKIASGDAAEKIGRAKVNRELYREKESDRVAAEGAKQILAAVKDGKTLAAALHHHLQSVLPEKHREAYLEGHAKGGGADDDSGAARSDAWTDGARPRIRTSEPFTRGAAPFSQVKNPSGISNALFDLKKAGDLVDDVVNLYEGYAIARFKERKPVDAKMWDEQRLDFIARLRFAKQTDALVAYMRKRKAEYDVKINVRLNAAAKPAK